MPALPLTPVGPEMNRPGKRQGLCEKWYIWARSPGTRPRHYSVVWSLPAQPMTVMFVRAAELMGIAP